MRKRVLITRQWPSVVLERMAEHYDIVVDPDDRPLTNHELARGMREFDAICPTITDKLDRTIIGQPDRRTRLFANFGAGYEHIDIGAAKANGIVVTNTPDVLTEATAELTILLMMMVARRATEGERQLRGGRWPGWHPMHMVGRSLHGLRLGFIGYGRIAQATARMARTLWDMEIGYHSRSRAALAAGGPEPRQYETLSALLEASDVVSVQCPGGSATHHLLDGDMLARMKPDALLINTARGSVVDEAALATALRTGTLAAAGLDVYENEPAVHPDLLDLENVVLLPHLGSATIETRVAMGLRAMANVDAFFSGKEPADRVA